MDKKVRVRFNGGREGKNCGLFIKKREARRNLLIFCSCWYSYGL